MKTTLPKTSPAAIAAKPSRRLLHRQHPVDDRSHAADVEQLGERRQLVAGAHRRADDPQLQEEDPGQLGVVGFGPLVVRETTSVPPGRSDLIECDQVAAPTVSMTASTRSGSRASALEHLVRAELERPRALLLVTAGGADPQARRPGRARSSAVATPPPAPCTSTVSPGLRPPWVKSMR